MNLEKYLVVAGMPGVHKLVANRNNGILIEDLHEGRTRFVPARQHQITPIATVAIYTDTEEGTIALTEVFQKMIDLSATTPPVSLNDASGPDFRAYFATVLPEYDRERVHINDIKKCIKWFNFMQEKGVFAAAQNEAAATAETEEVTETEEITPNEEPQITQE